MAAAGLWLWLMSLPLMDPDAMTDLGLLSVMPVTFYAALVVLTVGFFRAVRRGAGWLEMAVHLGALILILHGTTAILYGTVRYSWAWKHIGIVDYIQRNGFIEPDIAVLDVYHNWPSFFALMAFFTEFAGFESAASFAAWSTVVFNGLTVIAVVAIFKSLTADWRVVWTAAWLFLVTNWVGQDYFSPQAFAFLLYLVTLGVLIRWFSRAPFGHVKGGAEWIRLRVLRGSSSRRPVVTDGRVSSTRPVPPETPLTETAGVDGVAPAGRRTRSGRRAGIVSMISVTIGAAIITSHPLTPLILVAVIIGLAVMGVVGDKKISVALLALTVAWMVTGAGSYVGRQIADALRVTGDVTSNFGETFTDLSGASPGQVVVAWMGRGLVAAVVGLAVVGAFRWVRRREFDLRPFVLSAVPLALVVGGSYGGEVLFRIYLFSLPFAVFLGAHAFFPAIREGRSRRTSLTASVVSLVLLTGLLFAYFGKDRQYYFTIDEVRAAEYVYENAPAGTLLVEGSRNYPAQFVNYERFVYVPISREPRTTHARIIADPVGVMEDWMSNPAYPDALLIITRSQKAEVDATGVMPAGSLEAIEDALLASPLFDAVIHNDNATVFHLVAAPEEAGP